jgi:hypothetical protein
MEFKVKILPKANWPKLYYNNKYMLIITFNLMKITLYKVNLIIKDIGLKI